MIDLQFDFKEFERAAERIGGAADQLPYAISVALNDAVKVTRQYLIDTTWPKGVTVRDPNFMRAALRMEFATKKNLSVSIYDTLGRAHLAMHDKGGTKQAAGRLAIPTSRVNRSGRGVQASQRPRNLRRAVVKGNFIFQAVGRGKASKLMLMYKLQPSARIKADVPFTRDFTSVMQTEVRRAFVPAMQRAMATRK